MAAGGKASGETICFMSSVKVVYPPAPRCVNLVGKLACPVERNSAPKRFCKSEMFSAEGSWNWTSVAEVQGSINSSRMRGKVWEERAVQKAKQGTMHETQEHSHGRKHYTCAQSKLTAGQINDRPEDLSCFLPLSYPPHPVSLCFVSKKEGLIGKLKDRICPPHPTMGFRSEAEQTGTEEKLSFGRNSQHWFLHWNESHCYWNGTLSQSDWGIFGNYE